MSTPTIRDHIIETLRNDVAALRREFDDARKQRGSLTDQEFACFSQRCDRIEEQIAKVAQ